MQARIVSLAIPYSDISLAMAKIEEFVRRIDTDLDIGMAFLETLQTRYQPLHTERQRRGDHEPVTPCIVADHLAGAADIDQCL